MRTPGKVVIVSQHYPPDPSKTAAIMSVIAEHLAAEVSVLVLSGSSGSAANDSAPSNQPIVVEIRNWIPAKAALIKRAVAEASFTMRVFIALLKSLAARRRSAHRYRPLYAALRGCRCGQIEARTLCADHA
jgi:colanic acid biosynthesis glycosyl transferase WcaI